MGLPGIKESIIRNIKNIPGPKVSEKIVVIECDDWGGIRTPSKEVYDNLVDRNLVDPHCRYRFDTLATVEDMEQLFYTLGSVKGLNDKPAVMTPIVNVANPDFKRIEKDDYQNYYFEEFSNTLERYGRGKQVLDLWREGLSNGVFVPEIHGKEHIAVQLWMEKLREGHDDLRYAFSQEYVSLEMSSVPPAARGFRAEFYFENERRIPFLRESIKEGVTIFRKKLGYSPKLFVPSNGIFHPQFETTLADSGIQYLNVMHLNPIPEKGDIRLKYYRNGKQSQSGLTYCVRNCAFEPSDPKYIGVDATLKQIESAFRWRKPAVISTHRVNFVGGIDPQNREKGLRELQKLLELIQKKWPDVIFMSSRDLLNCMYKKA
ncbi:MULTISPECIES: hypothetical protein [unclassified Carboxylicivirga]|uniref:hypothetical protein n=1 Tax=Carboxylicivirga TaxID=1628153 RepID=UPI003D32CAAA